MNEERLLSRLASTRRAVRGLGLLSLVLSLPLIALVLFFKGEPGGSSTTFWISTGFFLGFFLGGIGLLLWQNWGRSLLVFTHSLNVLGTIAIGFWPGAILSFVYLLVLLDRKVRLLISHEGSAESAALSQRAEEAIDIFD